ncbi:MAG: MBL fold metallo-hydrolase [Thermoanaerobaculia bacterium]
MSLRVVALGTGTCVPRRRRGPAGYVVETPEQLVLIDSGSGTLGRLAEAGLDYRRLTHALYTHTHTDHTADLGPLLFALNHTPGFERQETLHVVGPPGFGKFLEQLSVPWPWIRPSGDWLELDEVDEGRLLWPGFELISMPVDHCGIPANAYRMEAEGRAIVFSGDTRLCPAIVEIARGADLLVIEAAVAAGEEGTEVHMTAAQAGRVAVEAGVSKVVLTHLYPACDETDLVAECEKKFQGEIAIGEDLMEIYRT